MLATHATSGPRTSFLATSAAQLAGSPMMLPTELSDNSLSSMAWVDTSEADAARGNGAAALIVSSNG